MIGRSERDIWIDALRGIAIVLVVLGHALRGLENAGLSIGPVFDFLDARLYAVHVQLLFFVSGVVMVASLRRRGAGPFAASRFPAILWPLIIWTYVFVCMKLLAGPYQNEPVSWEVLLISPIPGQLHLWFLWALFLMHVLVAALWSVTSERARGRMLVALFAVSLVTASIRLPAEIAPWIGLAVRYLPCLALGLLLGFHGIHTRRGGRASLVSAAVAIGAFLFAPQIKAATGSSLVPSLLACLGAYFSAALVLSLPRVTRGLAYLGTGAMAIYVLHTIFSAGTREVLLAAGMEGRGLHLVLGVLAGIVLPIIVRDTCLRIRLARPLALA